MNDDICNFFLRRGHYQPDVIRRLVTDIDTLCTSLSLSRKITTWGTTEQPKICLYGGLPVNFTIVGAADDGSAAGSKSPQTKSFVLPVQIWLSHQFPVEPPFMYMICNRTSENAQLPGTFDSCVVKIVARHPYVDLTGLCYCAQFAQWHPQTSSLCYAIEQFCRSLEKCGRCPIYIDEGTGGNAPAADENDSESERKSATDDALDNACLVCFNKKDTVLVPCGHFCLCVSCAANLSDCPLCRSKIMVRQRIFGC